MGNALETPLRFDDLPAVPPAGRDAYQPMLAVTSTGARALGTSEVNLGAGGSAPYAGTGATIVPGSSSTFTLAASPTEDVFPSVAVVPRGAGLFAYATELAGAGQSSVQARVQLQAGGLSPTALTLSDPARGPVNLNVPSAAADGTDAASVAYSQGATNMSIHVATVDLPRLPVVVAAPRDAAAPRVTGFGLSRRTFRKGTRLPKLSAVKTGTTIRFRLSEKATVRLSFERKTRGRRVGRTCRKATRRNRTRRRCTRYVRVRTAIRLNGKAGANSARFQGRLSRTRSLVPGSYRMSLVATDTAKNASKRQRKAFRLLKAAKRKKRKR